MYLKRIFSRFFSVFRYFVLFGFIYVIRSHLLFVLFILCECMCVRFEFVLTCERGEHSFTFYIWFRFDCTVAAVYDDGGTHYKLNTLFCLLLAELPNKDKKSSKTNNTYKSHTHTHTRIQQFSWKKMSIKSSGKITNKTRNHVLFSFAMFNFHNKEEHTRVEWSWIEKKGTNKRSEKKHITICTPKRLKMEQKQRTETKIKKILRRNVRASRNFFSNVNGKKSTHTRKKNYEINSLRYTL